MVCGMCLPTVVKSFSDSSRISGLDIAFSAQGLFKECSRFSDSVSLAIVNELKLHWLSTNIFLSLDFFLLVIRVIFFRAWSNHFTWCRFPFETV